MPAPSAPPPSMPSANCTASSSISGAVWQSAKLGRLQLPLRPLVPPSLLASTAGGAQRAQRSRHPLRGFLLDVQKDLPSLSMLLSTTRRWTVQTGRLRHNQSCFNRNRLRHMPRKIRSGSSGTSVPRPPCTDGAGRSLAVMSSISRPVSAIGMATKPIRRWAYYRYARRQPGDPRIDCRAARDSRSTTRAIAARPSPEPPR